MLDHVDTVTFFAAWNRFSLKQIHIIVSRTFSLTFYGFKQTLWVNILW